MAGSGIDASHCADHLRTEQNVPRVNHFGEQVHAGLMVNAGVEKNVVHDVTLQIRLSEHVGEPAVTTPVIRYGATAMRDDKAESRKIPEQIALDQLHEGDSIRSYVISAGRMQGRVAGA